MHLYTTYQILRVFEHKKNEVRMLYWQFIRKLNAVYFPIDQRRILHLHQIRH